MGIALAIRNRRLLRFRYRGHPRTVEPHILGDTAKGDRALSAYQVSGGSQSGQHAGWKLFYVDEIVSLSILKRGFSGPRPDYNPEDRCFTSVIARLERPDNSPA
jgi:hypothetical protein